MYLDSDINLFVMYRASGPSLLIESTDSDYDNHACKLSDE